MKISMFFRSEVDLYDELRSKTGGISGSVSELYTLSVLASNSLFSVIKRPAACFFNMRKMQNLPCGRLRIDILQYFWGLGG